MTRYRLSTREAAPDGATFKISRAVYTNLAELVDRMNAWRLQPGAVSGHGLTILEILIESEPAP